MSFAPVTLPLAAEFQQGCQQSRNLGSLHKSFTANCVGKLELLLPPAPRSVAVSMALTVLVLVPKLKTISVSNTFYDVSAVAVDQHGFADRYSNACTTRSFNSDMICRGVVVYNVKFCISWAELPYQRLSVQYPSQSIPK